MTNFTALRMGTLQASHSAVTDDVREAKIFVADKVQRRLSSHAEVPYDLGFVGAKDDEPTMLSFFNGKPHAEGLKAYNEWLASHGRGPIPTGKK